MNVCSQIVVVVLFNLLDFVLSCGCIWILFSCICDFHALWETVCLLFLLSYFWIIFAYFLSALVDIFSLITNWTKDLIWMNKFVVVLLYFIYIAVNPYGNTSCCCVRSIASLILQEIVKVYFVLTHLFYHTFFNIYFF